MMTTSPLYWQHDRPPLCLRICGREASSQLVNLGPSWAVALRIYYLLLLLFSFYVIKLSTNKMEENVEFQPIIALFCQ